MPCFSVLLLPLEEMQKKRQTCLLSLCSFSPLFLSSHPPPSLQLHRSPVTYFIVQPSSQGKEFSCLYMWNGAGCSQAGLCLACVAIERLRSCRAIISVPIRKLYNYREKQQALQSLLLCVRSFKMSLKRNSEIMKALTHFQSNWQDIQEEATRLGGLHHLSWLLGTDPRGCDIWDRMVWSQDGIK